MRVVRFLICCLRGHRWRPRRFCFQGAYCEACERCGAETNNHAWDGCRCAKCGVPSEAADPAHHWLGCTCRTCGLQRHQWVPWNEGKKCRLCGEQFLAWNDYLKVRFGKSWADDADFVLAIGEAIRQEVFRKYEKARDAFRRQRTQRTMFLYQAVPIAEPANPHQLPGIAQAPTLPAYAASPQFGEPVRVEREACRKRNRS